MQIIVRNNDPIKAYKILSKKLFEDGLFIELKEREHFKSKSQRSREQKKRAIVRCRKEDAKRKLIADKIEYQVTRGGQNGKRKPTITRK